MPPSHGDVRLRNEAASSTATAIHTRRRGGRAVRRSLALSAMGESFNEASSRRRTTLPPAAVVLPRRRLARRSADLHDILPEPSRTRRDHGPACSQALPLVPL